MTMALSAECRLLAAAGPPPQRLSAKQQQQQPVHTCKRDAPRPAHSSRFLGLPRYPPATGHRSGRRALMHVPPQALSSLDSSSMDEEAAAAAGAEERRDVFLGFKGDAQLFGMKGAVNGSKEP
ncbi:uncharacterized protein LOC142356224 isoform X2 [Convolutriloba macropyga]|uniref:uncharacterized protein LOC142356224 isoform X2 n=1 Tax=Convolutriloba macropyga TaxID=536237 RepID=UPI003F51B88E